MKHAEQIHRLANFLETQSIVLNEAQVNQLKTYTELLYRESARTNIVSRGDRNFLVEKHLLSGFYYVYLLKKLNLKKIKILDLGSGAGFPGVAVSIALPEAEITLLDSSRKKYLFLKKTIAQIGINGSVVCERVESWIPLNRCSVVVARSVASMEKLINWSRPIIDSPGRLITIKGDDVHSELKNIVLLNEKIIVSEIEPEWVDFSPYLEHKKIVKVEF